MECSELEVSGSAADPPVEVRQREGIALKSPTSEALVMPSTHSV